MAATSNELGEPKRWSEKTRGKHLHLIWTETVSSWYFIGIVCGTKNERGLLCFVTLKSKVTLGVIICDVRTDTSRTLPTHTRTPTHILTFTHGHAVPGAHMHDSQLCECVSVCVCVCLLSYGKGFTSEPRVEWRFLAQWDSPQHSPSL